MAYGSAYRYCALTSLLRRGDWRACAEFLGKAFQIDPSLTADLDLFYELALGAQPLGYRGTPQQLDLLDNEAEVTKMLANVIQLTSSRSPALSSRRLYGTAYYALGLAAYNTGQYALSRRFLLKALFLRPHFLRDRRMLSSMMKSLAGRAVLTGVKRLRSHLCLAPRSSS